MTAPRHRHHGPPAARLGSWGVLGVVCALQVLSACSDDPAPTPASCGDGHVDEGEQCDDGNLEESDGCLSSCVLARCGDGQVWADQEACDDGNDSNTDDCLRSCELPSCGDGFVQRGIEVCDDGNDQNADGCGNDCLFPRCGDGVVQDMEGCDDGNLDDTDACLSTCLAARCGDGIVAVDQEQCDDGNRDDLDGCRNDCTLARCGDGIVHVGVEPCDDGNDVGDDSCGNDCSLPTCGDGVVQAPELCDDGNRDDTDGCLTSCLLSGCGDGIVQAPEECDDANGDPSDGCLGDCTLATCGDGVVRAGVEACDDGDADDTNGCRNDCRLPSCGDGVEQGAEQCDDGNADNRDGCLDNCLLARCGDGVVQVGSEACDDGNLDDTDGCRNDCTLASCGDGVLWQGVEACDDGNFDDTDGCRVDCTLPSCGDMVVQAPEQCDDGDADDGDGCLRSCLRASCGDGMLWRGVEACDDGNRNDDDGCRNDCTLASCGDGRLQAPEACDDGNGDNTDACLSTCADATCGDGFVWVGQEACDDGNLSDTDACLADCRPARCGDGQRWVGVEQCDDGNDDDADGCLNDCQLARCGDGVVRDGYEQCDDQNTDNTDGCLIDCRTLDYCEQFGITGLSEPVACFPVAAGTVTVAGTGFLVIDGRPPSVMFDRSPVAGLTLSGCEVLPGVFNDVEVCDTLSFDRPGGLAVGDYEIVVRNRITQDCSARVTFSVGPPPTISNVLPAEVCADTQSPITIEGSGFVASSAIRLERVGDGLVFVPIGTPVLDASAVPQTLTATFPPLPVGTYDLFVSNGAGCGDTAFAAITVRPQPIIYFIDPPVAYNGFDLDATLFVANINGGGIATVGVRPLGGGAFQTIAHSFDPGVPGRVSATLPKDLVADGSSADYEVTLTDQLGCVTSLNGIVNVSKVVTMAPVAIRPPFGGGTETTAITLVISNPGAGGTLVELPRVYLRDSTGTVTQLTGVSFTSATEVGAVVPAGLGLGFYDLIVVNPDATVGVETGAYSVTASAPPLIDTISPGSIAGSGITVRVLGENFDNPAVDLFCRAYDAPAAVPVRVPVPSAGITPRAYGLDFVSPAGIGLDEVCIVRVTNTVETSYGEFSALVQLNGAQNVPRNLLSASTLNVGRSSPIALVGSVSRTTRFLYVFGGDPNDATAPIASAEVAPLSPFGDIGGFRRLPVDLPAGLTYASGQTIGRFHYIVGGDEGTGAVATVLRAEVLRPEAAPVLSSDIDIALDAAGVGPGLWYYRVSATMSGADLDNPLGETLPSEPLAISVPPWAPDNFRITLRWAALPGALSYHVYRSPTADGPLTSVARLASNLTMTQYTDTGTATGGARPRRLGDLGDWVKSGGGLPTGSPLPSLPAARSQLGTAIARDPDPGLFDTRFYLYALAGADASATATGAYSYLRIDVGANGSHTVAASWTSGAGNTVPARRLLAGFSVDSTATILVGLRETWIYSGPGLGVAQGSRFYSAIVTTGGALSSWSQASPQNTNQAAYGGAAAANQLFVFGGASDLSPSTVRDSALVQAGADVGALNASGSQLVEPRVYPGTAVGSGRMFIVGGTTTDGASTRASTSIESTVW